MSDIESRSFQLKLSRTKESMRPSATAAEKLTATEEIPHSGTLCAPLQNPLISSISTRFGLKQESCLTSCQRW